MTKYPYLSINKSNIDFGSVKIGHTNSVKIGHTNGQEIIVTNNESVRANFL